MLTTRTLPALLGAAVLTLAACSSARAPAPTEEATPKPTPTEVPGAGGGSGGNGGVGVIGGGGIIVPNPNGDPLLGQATFVTPVAGLVNLHPVSVQLIRALANAQGARVELRWWSGVAPCNALDRVEPDIDEAARTINLTVFEGSGPGNQVCIDLAQLKAVVVEIGSLAPGTWTITAEGDAPAFALEVK